MCDSGEKTQVNLMTEKMEKIILNFNSNERIDFDLKTNKWNPYIVGSSSVNPNLKKSKTVHNKDDIERIQNEIEEKNKKISDLQTKIAKKKKKIATLKNILKIDVGEQLYLQDLLKDKKNLDNENNL